MYILSVIEFLQFNPNIDLINLVRDRSRYNVTRRNRHIASCRPKNHAFLYLHPHLKQKKTTTTA